MSSSSSKLLDPETTSYKVFVTIKNRDMLDNSDGYYKKLILMVPGNMTISAFKREVEKEYSDLFPFDEPLICAKLEDEYGYALSNSSKAYELLKGGDRVIAVPSAKGHGGSRYRIIISSGCHLECF